MSVQCISLRNLRHIKEFEYRIAACASEDFFSSTANTRQSKASLNNRLRRALIGVKLPAIKRYDEWVMAVKDVVVELESFVDYRPKGATQIGTKIGLPKSGSAALASNSSKFEIDGEGDTKMTGMDAILAAINDLKLQNSKSNSSSSNHNNKSKNKNRSNVKKVTTNVTASEPISPCSPRFPAQAYPEDLRTFNRRNV